MKSVTVQNPYGFCPVCGAPGSTRGRCLNGNDTCTNGHTYPSATAIFPPVQPIGVETLEAYLVELDDFITRFRKHVADMKEIASRNQ